VSVEEWTVYKRNGLFLFAPATKISLCERDGWLRVGVGRLGRADGSLFLPERYGDLWRRLCYAAIYWQNILEAWDDIIRGAPTLSNDPGEHEFVWTCRGFAALRAVQYSLYRRHVLKELQTIRFSGGPPPNIHSLDEVGIRHFRDWHTVTFEEAQKEGKGFLKMDPAAQTNILQFSM
jgi:hypothetical protein